MKLLIVNTGQCFDNHNVNWCSKGETLDDYLKLEWDYIVFGGPKVVYTPEFYNNVNNLSRIGQPQIIYSLRKVRSNNETTYR